ncbi:MAG: cobalamin B12-binding domain-containing protein [Theionarchaea archaeon]|nr:cobalamin B12-binding domain-containing protein [Theionarchaea archaeon]
MKVLFINPPYRLYPPFEYTLCDPPRNLTLLAAILQKEHDVEIFDMPILGKDFHSVKKYIEDSDFSVIGIANRATYSFPMVKRIAEDIKTVTTTPIMVGGTYVSFAPREAMELCPEIDYVIVGEGEYSTPALLEYLQGTIPLDDVGGVAYRHNGEIVCNPPRKSVENLDELPMPANELLPLDAYIERNQRYILEASRGCLYRCFYCTSSYNKTLRSRSSENILKEIIWAYKRGFRRFYFIDDIFTVKRDLAVNINEGILDAGLELAYYCMTRVDSVDEELLTLMGRAGCRVIAYGVESAAEETLTGLGRSKQFEEVKRAFSLTRKAGIQAQAFIMCGLPHSTFKNEIEIINLLREVNPSSIGGFCFKPFPGTKYYDSPESEGIKYIEKDFSRFSFLDIPTHETEDLAWEEIVQVMMTAHAIYRIQEKFTPGTKYKRKKKVTLIKTDEGGIFYNPFKPVEKRKTDMFLSCVRLDNVSFEILYRCDGFHNVEDIVTYVSKLFDLEEKEAETRVHTTIEQLSQRNIIEKLEW